MSTLTVMIAPAADAHWQTSRVRLVATSTPFKGSALTHYRAHPTEWVEVGQMRARTPDEIRRGHYWQVVCIEPDVAEASDDLEHALSPATFTVSCATQCPSPTPTASLFEVYQGREIYHDRLSGLFIVNTPNGQRTSYNLSGARGLSAA